MISDVYAGTLRSVSLYVRETIAVRLRVVRSVLPTPTTAAAAAGQSAAPAARDVTLPGDRSQQLYFTFTSLQLTQENIFL